jgi:hypothetical protein
MLAARRTTATVAIESVQVVSLEIAVDSFATGACGAAPRRRLHDNQWSLVLLGHFGWRKPGLLQRGILAEQRFLQRPSHTLSLLRLKFLEPPVRSSASAVPPQASKKPAGFDSTAPAAFDNVEPPRLHGMRSSLTER